MRFMSTAIRPVYETIKQKLSSALSPTVIEIVDESHKHAGHAGMQGHAAVESHFQALIVSEKFDGMPLVARHRLVYDTLSDEMKQIHALAIKTKTPTEYAKMKVSL